MDFCHSPVLLHECIDNLNIKPDGIYIDGTMGGAGHSSAICSMLSSNGRLIAIDQDINAIEAGRKRLSSFANAAIVHNNFSNILDVMQDLGINSADGILLDLGVSSPQLDTPERGFSYNYDSHLDMRMNQNQELSAYDVINKYSEEELKNIIYSYGEEKWAARIAKFIVEQRTDKPIETTFEFVDIIKAAIPKGARSGGPHPAKRTFQAIRIEVNKELEILKKSIEDMCRILNSGGRLCIITFHSLEDRIVKNTFRTLEKPCTCPPEFPICVCGKKPVAKVITRKPIYPPQQEIEDNNRARSAKLRVLQKL